MIYIKKFFVIFSCMLILVSTLIIPVSATLGDSYMDQQNLLSESNTVNPLVNGSGGSQPFYYAYLEGGKDYTFYAPKGVNKLLVSPIVDNPVYIYPVVYERPSYNLYNGIRINSENGFIYRSFTPPNFGPGKYKLVFSYQSSSSFDFFLQIGTTTANRVDLLYNTTVSAGAGSREYTFTISQSLYDQFQNNMLLLVRSLNGDVSMNMIIVADEDADTVVYEPNFTNPFYYPYQLTMVNFHCEKTGEYAIGFNANSFDGYSRITSSDNPVVLVEGAYSFDSLLEQYYNNGYSSGYDSGFASGETSGLESSGMLRNLIFTIFSVPFVFIRNALDFEILGINFKNIVLVLLSASLVAWVIRIFKKGE